MNDVKMLSLADPILGEDERQALCDVVSTGWLTMGDRVREFERAFAASHGVADAVALGSATAGLHLALAVLGIGPGDEVLLPSLTFVATAAAVLYVGATPVFVDIESLTNPHMSYRDAEAKMTARTRAVMTMHYGGYAVDMTRWRKIADSHGVALVEDAAHAAGLPGVGLVSDVAIFSFFSNKNMTTAEGGMAVARNPTTLESLRRLRSHGMTTSTLDRSRGHAYSYDVTTLGYNYRLDELRGALGLCQLAKLAGWNDRRRELTEVYRQRFAAQCPSIAIPFDRAHPTAAHLMSVILPSGVDRAAMMAHLREVGIQSSIHYPPVHKFSYYIEKFPGVDLPITEQFSSRELTVPLHPAMSDKDAIRVVEAIAQVLSKS